MRRPFVYVNMAMTADGKITSARREYPRFTSELDRLHMDRLRAAADAILVGAGTLRADDPLLHVRTPEMRELRRSLGKPEGLLRVVVTRSADIDGRSRFFSDDGAPRIVATVETADAARLERLRGLAEVWTVGREQVDFGRLLELLAGRGVERLLVEGGGDLNWSLVAADLVDELHVTLAPALLGGSTALTLLEGEGFAMARQRRLSLAELRREGDEIYCRWTVVR